VVYLSDARTDWLLSTYTDGQKLEFEHLVPQTLAKPVARFSFRTLHRDEEAPRGVCYVGKPDRAYDDAGTPLGGRIDELFLVIINCKGVMHKSYWYPRHSKQNPNMPLDFEDGFLENF